MLNYKKPRTKWKGGESMSLTIGEKINVILKRRGLTLSQLAEETGQSRQNLSNKMNRDNFSEKEAIAIAAVLNCSFTAEFVMNDTGERI